MPDNARRTVSDKFYARDIISKKPCYGRGVGDVPTDGNKRTARKALSRIAKGAAGVAEGMPNYRFG
ncbi:hypothetical protein X976_5703 [Burkholderia pseudomallei MSHR7500]|nr:hypothetical protein X976_5703 [Burkholderia pseudomallei MSHR7500]